MCGSKFKNVVGGDKGWAETSALSLVDPTLSLLANTNKTHKTLFGDPFEEPAKVETTEVAELPAEEKKKRASLAAAKQIRKAAAAMGAKSTILTSGQGVAGTAPTQKKTLLGA